MKKILLLAILAFTMGPTPTPSPMPTCSVPYIFSPNQTALSAQVNSDFSAAASCTNNAINFLNVNGLVNGFVSAVTGSGNMIVTAGPTPNVTITDSPTFAGNMVLSFTSPLSFTNTNGVYINGLATGNKVAFILDASNGTRPTNDLLDVQLHESNEFQVTNSGGVIAQGAFQTAATTGWVMTSTTGTTATSAALGSAVAFTIDAVGAGFSGDIMDFDTGVTPSVQSAIKNNGQYVVGQSNLGPTSGKVNGPLSVVQINGGGGGCSGSLACRHALTAGTYTFTFAATYSVTPVCVAQGETTPGVLTVAVTTAHCVVTSSNGSDTQTVDIEVEGP